MNVQDNSISLKKAIYYTVVIIKIIEVSIHNNIDTEKSNFRDDSIIGVVYK